MSLPISETAFASWFEELLDTYGYRWMHPRPARVNRGGRDVYETAYSGHKGYLDYTIAHEVKRRLIFAELKSEDGKLSPDQQLWYDTLKECVKMITLKPVVFNHGKMASINVDDMYKGKELNLIPSFEVYVWRPSQRDEIEEILK